MAFPVVEGTATSEETSDVTAHTVSLPSGIVSGELLVVWFSGVKFTSYTHSFPGDWVEISDDYVDKTGGAVAYLNADGTEGSTFEVTTSSAIQSGHVAFRMSGAGDTPEIAVLAASSADEFPDPPDLTPSWGSADTLWLASHMASQGKWVATPANYDNLILSPTFGASNFGQVGVARRELAATSENPAAFEIDWSSDFWIAQTVAIEPGGATPLNSNRVSSMHFLRYYEPTPMGT